MEMCSDRKKLPVLIYGATALGMAAALRLGSQAIVAEKTGFAAWEFAASFEPGVGPWKAVSPEGQALQSELTRRAVLSETGTHIQGAAPVFFHIAAQSGMDVRLWTRIAGLSEEHDGYTVTLWDSSGFHTVKATAILDTSSSGEVVCGSEQDSFCTLNAVLVPGEPNAALPVCSREEIELIPGNFADEWYLRYRLDAADSPAAARKKLLSFWENRGEGLSQWRIGAIAPLISRRPPLGTMERKASNLIWQPSAGCRNLLEAFETGLITASGLKGEERE